MLIDTTITRGTADSVEYSRVQQRLQVATGLLAAFTESEESNYREPDTISRDYRLWLCFCPGFVCRISVCLHF